MVLVMVNKIIKIFLLENAYLLENAECRFC